MGGTFPGSMMRGDLERMAQNPTPLIGRPNLDPSVIDDVDFRSKNAGSSRVQISEAWAARLRAEAEAEALRPYTEGAPPKSNDLAGWHAWKNALEDERDHEVSVRDRLLNHVSTATATQRTLAEAVTAGAKAMLASMGFGGAELASQPTIDPEQIERQLVAEQRAAAHATEALKIVEEKLATTDKRLAAVRARADQFVNPELVNIAGALGPRYIRAIAELREVSSLLFALGAEFGYGGQFGSGFETFEHMNFPRPGIATCRLVPPEKLKIGRPTDIDRTYWRNARNTLLSNPLAKISLPKAA